MDAGQQTSDVEEPIGGASQKRHWVRCTTACNNRCLFCLDADTPRDLILSVEEVHRDIDHGRELNATRVVLSGGEATLHPQFVDFVRYARQQGYEQVQCITNGHRFASRTYLERCLDAGLGEITFSLHGHTPELHDRLTRSPGAFTRVLKGVRNALRDGRAIVSVDICLNRQNIEHIEEIVDLCIRLGVTEFDLLHVIPQAAAFEHREQLFYDVREHLPRLSRVLRLNRHPQYHVFTNRLPAAHLEGFEELIQSPGKIADEIRGRRYQVRAYLDLGEKFTCRQRQRCVHCFVEPFCTSMDRVVRRIRSAQWKVWGIGDEPISAHTAPRELPFGCSDLGMHASDIDAALARKPPFGVGLYLDLDRPHALSGGPPLPGPLTLVARRSASLDAWLGRGPIPPGVTLEVELNGQTAPWMLAHRAALSENLDSVRVLHPRFERLAQTRAAEPADIAGFFTALGLPVRTVGFPACLVPGTRLSRARSRLDLSLFNPANGRLSLPELVRRFTLDGYLVKSSRCAGCVVDSRCDGAHINTIRNQGFRILRPLSKDAPRDWGGQALAQLTRRWPSPRRRLATGREIEPPHPSHWGHLIPTEVERDPLGVFAEAEETSTDSE